MSPLSQNDHSPSPPLRFHYHDAASKRTADVDVKKGKQLHRKRNSSPEVLVVNPLNSLLPLKPSASPPSPQQQQQGSLHIRRNSGGSGLFSLLRRNQRSSSFAHGSSYAGPRPVDKDGNPLKSCLSKTKSRSIDSKVSFSHVSIREYSRVVGDNPCVCCGPPLALGWKYNKRGRTDIDTFEAAKDVNGEKCQRRTANEREKLLTDIGGANHSQIMKGSMLANFDNKLRWQSFDRLGGENHYKSIGPRERVLIMKESARRKFDRACKGTSTFQEQQDLWDKAQELSLTKLKRQVTV